MRWGEEVDQGSASPLEVGEVKALCEGAGLTVGVGYCYSGQVRLVTGVSWSPRGRAITWRTLLISHVEELSWRPLVLLYSSSEGRLTR